jgi:hypothetical protein
LAPVENGGRFLSGFNFTHVDPYWFRRRTGRLISRPSQSCREPNPSVCRHSQNQFNLNKLPQKWAWGWCRDRDRIPIKNDDLIDDLAGKGIAFVPYFPLGGFTPLQSEVLSSVAADLGKTPMQVALAWLLHRSPNILLIPGTSSLTHLRENLAAAELKIPSEHLDKLNAIGAASK